MSEKEKKTTKLLEKAIEVLPEEKVEYLIGYAEGVAAMAEKKAERDPPAKTDRPAYGPIRERRGEYD